MDAFTVSTVLEEVLVEVLANIHAASAKVAEWQKHPDFEPQKLALHTRALTAQTAALKALSKVLDQLTRLQKPASDTPERAVSDQPPESAEKMLSEFAALQGEIPDLIKNISPPASPLPPGEGRVRVSTSSPPTPISHPQTPIPYASTQNSLSRSPHHHSARPSSAWPVSENRRATVLSPDGAEQG